MHVCLLPTEILLHIFTINIQDCKLGSSPRATLAALARTCRHFKEPALDILWKDIIGFKPLISCLPEGVSHTDVQRKLTLKRPILIGEWKVINRYARRIRSFRVNSPELDMIDNQVVQVLMSAPSPAPLLPNLHSLRWCDDRERFFPLLSTLLGTTITSLQLGCTSAFPSFAQSALLVSIGGRCPSIRELVGICVGDSVESSDAICEALCGLRQLSRLDTGALRPRQFLRLASLPSLRSLDFTLVTHDIHEMQPGPTPTILSRLDELHLNASSESVVNHFLRCVRLPSCRSVKVDVNYSDLYDEPEVPYDPLDISRLIISLSKCLSPALEKLQIQFAFDFSPFIDGDMDTLSNPSFALGFDAVAPLLPFSRLTDLQLDWMCTSAISDASLKTIAQSLPQLESFRFGGAARWLIPPSLTFVGLVHLIQHCPRLHFIQMSFCAMPVVYDTDPFFFETVPNEKITILGVGMSPISDPHAVVGILLKLLPKLHEVTFLDWLDDDIPAPPPFEQFDDGWDTVNEILRPVSYPTGSAHGTAPPTPNTIISGTTQFPAQNGVPSVLPPIWNFASQSQPNLSNLPPNFMSSNFIQSMSALEDLDPSMFRTDFEQDFREWFDSTGVDLR
ncbi:hypothetical protein EDB19DRAFT_1852109 [Suillus lakei]|nr:hypothetical protein EDB19DRAFT_1852109 [Suillus lakei]